MKNSKYNNIEFYQNLGKLFYAIASSDKKVKKIEFDTLKDIVTAEWCSLDEFEDEFNSDAAFQIEIVFGWLDINKSYNANQAFQKFIDYKKEHQRAFTSLVNQRIMKTARSIAASFSGVNKSELIMLAKLEIELKK